MLIRETEVVIRVKGEKLQEVLEKVKEWQLDEHLYAKFRIEAEW